MTLANYALDSAVYTATQTEALLLRVQDCIFTESDVAIPSINDQEIVEGETLTLDFNGFVCDHAISCSLTTVNYSFSFNSDAGSSCTHLT